MHSTKVEKTIHTRRRIPHVLVWMYRIFNTVLRGCLNTKFDYERTSPPRAHTPMTISAKRRLEYTIHSNKHTRITLACMYCFLGCCAVESNQKQKEYEYTQPKFYYSYTLLIHIRPLVTDSFIASCIMCTKRTNCLVANIENGNSSKNILLHVLPGIKVARQ